MKQFVLCLTLLLSCLCFAQQQGQPPPDTQQQNPTDAQPPTSETPPVIPGEPQAPGQEPTRPLPPDEEAPPPQAMSTQEVQQQIMSQLGSEPGLDHTDLVAQVNDSSVVLTGSVTSEEQHDLAVRIAQSYAGDRYIVDKIEVQQQI